VSVASIWEVAVKHRSRKLDIPPARFRDELTKAGAAILAIGESHAIETANVLLAHGDPFDRILVATAMVEGLHLLTADAHLLDAADANASLPIVPV
jgi:PIN domain nuclease of toxin-antitoxin system